jgi:hypothetical protein
MRLVEEDDDLRRALPGLGLWMVATLTSTESESTPFSGEQLDRIDAGVRAQALPDTTTAATAPPPADPRPLWVTNELRDEGMRLVIHVRLPVAGNLDNLDRNQARCTQVRERMREFLLPGQRVELYLVFDDSVHACRDDR